MTDPVATADALWRTLVEQQPAVAAALAEQLRGLPEDWPSRGPVSVGLGVDLAPGTLVVAVGPAGAGKSHYADTAAVDAVICLDSLRREIGGDAGDQSVTPAAVARQNELLDQYLRVGATVFLDSTNVEVRVRAGLIELARQHRRPAVALRFLPDLETCQARNRLRPVNRRVPDDTLGWQHALAQEATEQALLAEGFTAVYQVAIAPSTDQKG